MRDYGKVYATFWSSPTTSSLSDTAKLLALYLMTCGHSTIAGVFRLPDGYVAEDLGWTASRVREGFDELFANGFATRCEASKWVWVRMHLRWNKPENPNQWTAARKIGNSVPESCSWRRDFHSECGVLMGLDPLPDANPSATVAKPFRNQEQKAGAGTEAGTGVGGATPPSAAVAPATTTPAADPLPAEDASPRGTRLAVDWQLPKAWGEWALQELRGWTADVVRLEASKFADFWRSKTGKDATKLDWFATWRNWCRNAKVAPAPRTLQDQVDSSLDRAERVRAQLRKSRGGNDGEGESAHV